MLNIMKLLSLISSLSLVATATAASATSTQTEVHTVSVTTTAPAPTNSPPKKPASKKPGSFENSPVVPIQLCTFKGARCLDKQSIEFVNPVLEFDNVASFVLTAEGLLYRLDDGKCAQAVKRPAGFHDLEFTGCAVPDYVTAALEIQGLGGTQPAATTGPHTVWRYDEDKQKLCAPAAGVCMYSDEGYVLLGTKGEIAKMPPRSSAISTPLVVPSGQSLAEHILNMLEAMTYNGKVFWAKAWDTNVVSVVRYKLLAAGKKEVDFGEDIAPLWQVINECRQLCDAAKWCHSFSFPVTSRVCTLSAEYPDVPKDSAEGDVVVFVQNKNYNRDDYVLE